MKGKLVRVLLVDDDEDIRSIARIALEAVGGLEVEACATAEEGLAAIASFRPDLVLLDVEMPGPDGPSTLAKIKADAQTAQLPVIFLTARSGAEEARRYRSLGALDVISKPFDPMTLARQIEEIWARD